jgi:hypothetical protein
MSDYCSYCNVVSRNACSTYKRKYLEEELRNCPNLNDKAGGLIRAGFYEAGRSLEAMDELEAYRNKYGPL